MALGQYPSCHTNDNIQVVLVDSAPWGPITTQGTNSETEEDSLVCFYNKWNPLLLGGATLPVCCALLHAFGEYSRVCGQRWL